MTRFAQRVAGLASWVTVGLVLFSVALTGLLAFRAFEASRAQRQLTERTLQDYAGFAAFQLMNAMFTRVAGQHRAVFDLVARPSFDAPPAAPIDIERAAATMQARDVLCRCLDGASFFYRVTFADSAITTRPAAIPLPADRTLLRLRDTVIAQARASSSQLFFTAIFSEIAGEPYAFVHGFALGANNRPAVAYGYAMPAERFVGPSVQGVLRNQPILPGSLTRGLRVDSILAITVKDRAGRVVYATAPDAPTEFAASDSLQDRLGGLQFEVAIYPSAAERLIIGGLPASRVPEVLGTALLAVLLLGLLLYQFQRQEELARLRDDFVSGVSHELRTPLAQIRLLAELFRMGKVPTEEQKQRSLRIIDQEARRLSFLVDSILSFTRARNNRHVTVPAPTPTDISAEVDEIIASFAPLAEAQGARISTELAQGLVADVDRGALRQILLNLLDNAVRYGPPGQTITVRVASAADRWTLEVSDEGPGIPAEERERVFDPYYRLPRESGGAVGGTGIGLAVVRRLAQAQDGRVDVVSGEGGRGARFIVSLPIAAAGPGE